jgi:predicted amidohydrolase
MKLALIQMLVEPGRPEANRRRAAERIAEAARNGAEAAVLPEALNLGWTDPSARELAEPIAGGPTFQALSSAARENGLLVCAGLVEREAERIFNSAVLINERGELMIRHRKLNELDIAHNLYEGGDSLRVVDTNFGRVGVMICADAFVPGQFVARTLALMGADIILSPCAWAVPADHDQAATPYGDEWRRAYKPVARDFSIWIAGASNVGPVTGGPWAGRKCIGCSLVVGPGGEEIVQGPYGENAEAIVYVDVKAGARRRVSFCNPA